jgi:UDP-N-acetylglucosamine acyltransferase
MPNEIHPTAIIEGDVQLGDSNWIGPYCVLIGPLSLGNNNRIGPHVCIGTPGQDTKNPRYDSSYKRIQIGDDNIIRENTAIQKPLDTELTRVGSRNYFMHCVHVPHDAAIADDVTITPMCVLAGNVKVLWAANLGLGVAVHQHSVIGQLSMIGMNAAITKNLRPFAKYVPDRPLGVNSYALKKYGLLEFEAEVEAYVLHNRAPTSAKIRSIVEEFNALHERSGRSLY